MLFSRLSSRDSTRAKIGVARIECSNTQQQKRQKEERDDGKRVEVTRAELLVPGHAPVATPLARSTLVAKVTKLEPVRGGAASLSVDGTLGEAVVL